MSNVHDEISKKVKEKVTAIEAYKKLDIERERIIEELISRSKNQQNVDLTELNDWTMKMNQFAAEHQMPMRKLVTIELFQATVNKLD